MGVTTTSGGNVLVTNFGGSPPSTYSFTDVDGQTLASALAQSNVGTALFGVTKSGGTVYAVDFGAGNLVSLNNNGSVYSVIYHTGTNGSGEGIATNPVNQHIFVDAPAGILDIDPKTNSVRTINTQIGDGLSVSTNGQTVYLAQGGAINGYNTTTGVLTFSSGSITGSADGVATIQGVNKFAGNLVVNTNGGNVWLVDPLTSTRTLIATGGSRGDFVGYDLTNDSLFLTQTDSIVRLTCGASCSFSQPPPLPSGLASSPTNFVFPLQNPNNVYHLVTEIGGESSSKTPTPAYYDPLHTDGGHYSIDIASDASGNVVAAGDGLVVYVDSVRSKANDGPVVIIYNGKGYFTEYREFTTTSVGLGKITSGDPIGTYELGQTGWDGNRALHFQVKYNDDFRDVPADAAAYSAAVSAFSASHGGLSPFAKALELSSNTIEPQASKLVAVTLGGVPLDRYRLVEPKGGDVPDPLATEPPPEDPDKSLPIYLSPISAGNRTSIAFTSFNGINATIAGVSQAQLVEHSPAYLWSDITIPLDAQFLTFDYNWVDKGDGDYLSLYFNGELVANILGLDFTGTDFQTIGPISLFDLAGQTGELLFMLNSVGDPNADVQIGNLAFISGLPVAPDPAPEPSSLMVFAGGIFILLGTLARTRRGAVSELPSH